MRKTLVAAMLAVIATPAFSQQSPYRFTSLPDEIGAPSAIANDGTLVVRGGLYQHGEVKPLSPPGIYTAGLDINSNHTMVGTEFGDGGVPECPGFYGFLIARDGQAVTFQNISLTGINDQGTAVGWVSRCIVFPLPVLLIDGEFRDLGSSYPHLANSTFRPIRINNSGQLLGDFYLPPEYRRKFALVDKRSFTSLETPDVPGIVRVEVTDLNNGGQIVGWWEVPSSYPDEWRVEVSRGFLREADGTVVPIEWDYPWPSYLVQSFGSEEVTLHLIEPLGTRLYGLNDRGDVIARALARYEGQLANGTTVRHIEEQNGIGSRH